MFCFSKQFNFLLATAVCLATFHEFVIGTTTPASTEISEDSSDTATVTPFMTRDRISIMHYRYKMCVSFYFPLLVRLIVSDG